MRNSLGLIFNEQSKSLLFVSQSHSMFNMSTLRQLTRLKPTAPLVKGAVDNALLHSVPNLWQSLFKFARIDEAYKDIQEAQLPQRNSASAAHMEGGWG